MILTLHILVGVLSILVGIYALSRTSRSGLMATYSLGGLTALSGIILAIMNPNQITHVCVSGTLTLAVIGTLAYITNRRLATVKISSRD